MHAIRDLAALVDDRAGDHAAAADVAFGRTTERSMLVRSSTRTLENSSDSRTTAPEMMQPPETMELMAMPRRPSSSRMNFAGGCCTW